MSIFMLQRGCALKFSVTLDQQTDDRVTRTLPDNSYPSGNPAVIVARDKTELVCIVQEDKLKNARIAAVFGSSGSSTCRYPSGAVWYACAALLCVV